MDHALPPTLIAAAAGWYGFIINRNRNVVLRAFILVGAALSTFLVKKSLLDLLFFGHSPVFPGY